MFLRKRVFVFVGIEIWVESEDQNQVDLIKRIWVFDAVVVVVVEN